MLFDNREDGSLDTESRATGEIQIASTDSNPLFKIGKEHMLRLQGLVASVMFGDEKRFIKITSLSNYYIEDDDIFGEITFDVVFDILDNLEFVENVITYQDEHNL